MDSYVIQHGIVVALRPLRSLCEAVANIVIQKRKRSRNTNVANNVSSRDPKIDPRENNAWHIWCPMKKCCGVFLKDFNFDAKGSCTC